MKLKLKIAVLALAVWLTVCFLLYTEDGAAAAQRHPPSGVAAPQVANGFVPPALPLRRDTPVNGHSKSKYIQNQAGPEQGEEIRKKKSYKNFYGKINPIISNLFEDHFERLTNFL